MAALTTKRIELTSIHIIVIAQMHPNRSFNSTSCGLAIVQNRVERKCQFHITMAPYPHSID